MESGSSWSINVRDCMCVCVVSRNVSSHVVMLLDCAMPVIWDGKSWVDPRMDTAQTCIRHLTTILTTLAKERNHNAQRSSRRSPESNIQRAQAPPSHRQWPDQSLNPKPSNRLCKIKKMWIQLWLQQREVPVPTVALWILPCGDEDLQAIKRR